jgi:hypothetical protein
MAVGLVGTFHFNVRFHRLGALRLAGVHGLARTLARHLDASEGQNGGDEHQRQRFFQYVFHTVILFSGSYIISLFLL